MDTKTLIQALKKVVREEVRQVIKEELTEILKEGLQSTITEMQPKKSTETVRVKPRMVSESGKPTRKSNIQFSDNKFANILNDTDILPRDEQTVPSFSELMTEGVAFEHGLNDVSEMSFNSGDAMNFGAGRKAQAGMPMHPAMAAPSIMHDPETGKTMQVTPEVAQAMTRDYSALMKAMDKKKSK